MNNSLYTPMQNEKNLDINVNQMKMHSDNIVNNISAARNSSSMAQNYAREN